jgi:hypothetical protein
MCEENECAVISLRLIPAFADSIKTGMKGGVMMETWNVCVHVPNVIDIRKRGE